MTDCAILREPRLHVIGILGARVVFQVATHATRAGDIEIPIQVAGRAVQCGVNPGERETGELGVVKTRAKPTVHVVTCLAGCRESCAQVIGELRLSERLGMTRNAIRGKSLELARGRVLVTVVAGQGGVRSNERKAVFMCPEGTKAFLPASHRMAPLAVRSELPPVDVRVAIRTTCSGLREHQAHVALRTGNTFMQTPQRIACLGVVKLDDVAEWFPGREGMAIFTRNLQIAMRAVSRAGLRGLGRARQRVQGDENECHHQQRPPHAGPELADCIDSPPNTC